MMKKEKEDERERKGIEFLDLRELDLKELEERANYWERFVASKKDKSEYKEIFRIIEEADDDGTRESYQKANKLIKELDKDKHKYDLSIFNKKLKTLETRIERQMSTNLGSMIKSMREERGLSLQRLGEMSGVSGSYISRIETGERRAPSYPLIEKIAEALNVSMPTLLNVGALEESSEGAQDITTLLFSQNVSVSEDGEVLSPDEKESMINVIRYMYNMEWEKQRHEEVIEIMDLINDFKESQRK